MKTSTRIWLFGSTLLFTLVAIAATSQIHASRKNATASGDRKTFTIALDSLNGPDIQPVREKGFDPVKVTADIGSYRGRRALHMLNNDSVIGKGTHSGGPSK